MNSKGLLTVKIGDFGLATIVPMKNRVSKSEYGRPHVGQLDNVLCLAVRNFRMNVSIPSRHSVTPVYILLHCIILFIYYWAADAIA